MRKLTAPWSIEEKPGCYLVVSANGIELARLYFNDTPSVGSLANSYAMPTKDEARRVAANIAKLPDLLNAKGPRQPEG